MKSEEGQALLETVLIIVLCSLVVWGLLQPDSILRRNIDSWFLGIEKACSHPLW